MPLKKSFGFIVEYKASTDNDILVDFFKFPKTASRVMGIPGGSANFSVFLERYRKFVSKLSTSYNRRPIIIVLDNDSGVGSVQKVIKDIYKLDISTKIDARFFKIEKSLYIVKTPQTPTKVETSIEDFLDPKALALSLGGKTFSSQKDYDTTLHFGKFILSSHILKNFQSYSFSSFAVILDRIEAALNDAMA